MGTNFLVNFKELDIKQKVGQGGYGEVFRASWLGQEVAVKEYGTNYKRLHRRKVADFIKEVEVISNLRHPNIVLYMGVCINPPKLYMITEFLEGGSLFDLLHK